MPIPTSFPFNFPAYLTCPSLSLGQIVEFHKIAKGAVRRGVNDKRFKAASSGKSFAGRRELSSSERMVSRSSCHSTRRVVSAFFEREKINVAVGDRIRFTKNVKQLGQKFLNNELRTVISIDDGKIILDKGEIVHNGAALHLDQGIAVTSHASQAKTVDQVIASVPVRAFSQANEAQFYVTMSRARWAMHVFTDSKVALRDAIARSSKRLSSWELLDLAKQNRTLRAELAREWPEPKKQQREIAYER